MLFESSDYRIARSLWTENDKPDSHVERPVHLQVLNMPLLLYKLEHLRDRWKIRERGAELCLRNNPIKFGKATPRDMRKPVNLCSLQSFQYWFDVDAGWLKQLFSNTPP